MTAAMNAIPLVDLKAQYRAIGPEIEGAVARVLERQSFINAAETRAFEEEFAAFCEAPEAIGVSNGTTAIELILNALGVGAGDEVITVSHTFMATVGAVLRTGATPVMVDVDEATWTMSPEQVARAVTPRTRAILPVHLYGNPADVPAIAEAAPGIPIVEDAAQAHGARYHGRAVGSDSVAASYSFYPGKTLGAYGDAGAVTTADPELAVRLRRLRDHGRYGAKYEHQSVGTNARMSEIQAAVLRTKLAHLPEWIAARQRLCGLYEEGLADSDVRLQRVEPWAEHTWHLFVLLHPDRDRIAAALKERGISTGVHYPIPVHRQPAMADAPHRVQGGELPVTDALAATCLSLPIYPELGDDGVARVTEAVHDVLAGAHV
jgi:dTDP-4-amino-4,6-dideoxygalactose transaminase